ncbi:AsmA-like C-terminal region-containing protein [Luteolibacter arcticus]|uniref:AsmA-like C-terminal region-containing protein n=1 Tax=Luteolibacter arcticus TaxID=1581411 RepID=A0ABT3GDA7_9BACT|nr:AsmA-like C-terminal region-containing protein [Luteolibacter arcticus]MCW1921426.1 AsmA-like C-terminal region-containing protein [Luteolibacter arcticus]
MPAAPPSRWKRRIRRILVVLLLSPFLLLALANGLLATPWARGYLGRKLSARLGVETAVGNVTCTPWGGFTIGELRCLQPPPLRESIKAPLLEVREIQAHPQWSRLLRGELAISSVRIDRPRLTLSLEMAATMVSASAAAPAPVVTPPPVVATAETPAVEARKPSSQTPAPPAPPSTPPVSDSSTIGTAWMEITDAGCELWLAGSKLASLQGGEGKIPFAGAPAFSRLQLRELEIFGQVFGRDLTAPLSWRAPELRCNAAELRLADLEVKLSAALGVIPGSPFAVDISVPRQAARGDAWLQNMKPAAAQLEVRLQAIGLLRHPSTWQGVAAAGARNVTMQLGGQAAAFDEGRAAITLQGGVMNCPDFRLTGERASFLGNGQLRADGQGTAVLRVVVPPDTAAAWTERMGASGHAPVFAPLETPDRMFIDLRWISYSGVQGIELGAGGPVVPAEEFGKLLSDG